MENDFVNGFANKMAGAITENDVDPSGVKTAEVLPVTVLIVRCVAGDSDNSSTRAVNPRNDTDPGNRSSVTSPFADDHGVAEAIGKVA